MNDNMNLKEDLKFSDLESPEEAARFDASLRKPKKPYDAVEADRLLAQMQSEGKLLHLKR